MLFCVVNCVLRSATRWNAFTADGASSPSRAPADVAVLTTAASLLSISCAPPAAPMASCDPLSAALRASLHASVRASEPASAPRERLACASRAPAGLGLPAFASRTARTMVRACSASQRQRASGESAPTRATSAPRAHVLARLFGSASLSTFHSNAGSPGSRSRRAPRTAALPRRLLSASTAAPTDGESASSFSALATIRATSFFALVSGRNCAGARTCGVSRSALQFSGSSASDAIRFNPAWPHRLVLAQSSTKSNQSAPRARAHSYRPRPRRPWQSAPRAAIESAFTLALIRTTPFSRASDS